MHNSRKLIVFDCDGTLVDSQHMICAAMQQAFADHALPCPPREKLLSIVGLSLAEAFQRLGEGADGFPIGSLVERYKNAFFALRERGEDLEPLFPGARETLDYLATRPDVVLGMATGKSQRGVRAVLGRHGLLERFHTIKTADDAPSKPHPGMVLEALREAGVEPQAALVVGDTTYDIDMAHAAGTFAVGVGWGYHAPAALRGCGAHAVIDDFADLTTAIGAIWPQHGFGR
ncbi:MAG: HAD-IA family hydrolase [Pseudorhodoplanes sp.]|nr:HAD-IA family hydrolase [Pseudorhodoplanes sp.]GIK82317.1 MAG: haloacid dehalogenase [Alphaproteobacteria bacterium]